METDEKLKEYLAENFPDDVMMIPDGFAPAFLGVTECEPRRCVYSVRKMREVLEAEGMTSEDAQEHLSYNVLSAWVGETTPIYIHEP